MMDQQRDTNGFVLPKQTYTLKRIDAPALSAHWPWIREKLLIIHAKVQRAFKKRGIVGPPQSLPEQIRFAILQGLAGQNTIEAYFVLDGEGALRGFFTTSSPIDEFYRVPLQLYIWHAWGEPGVMQAIEPEVEKMARSRGMLAIEHDSPIEGWLRRHRRTGYRLCRITFRKEL